MPRTCLACSSPEREAIDKALATGESFRNIAKRFGTSSSAVFRHKAHIKTPPTNTPKEERGNDSGLGAWPVTEGKPSAMNISREMPQTTEEPPSVEVVRQPTENSGGKSASRTRSLANLKPFKPGQSGNPGGRPKGIVARSVRKQLKVELAAGVRQVDCLADAMIQKAIRGDVGAATFVRDTSDGRPGSSDDRANSGVGLSVMVTFSDDGSFTTGESPEPEQAVTGPPASNQPTTQPVSTGRTALPPATSPTEGSCQSIVQPSAPRFPRTRTGAAMAFLRGRGRL